MEELFAELDQRGPPAAVLGYLLFGEVLTPVQGAGMTLAALGVAVASRG